MIETVVAFLLGAVVGMLAVLLIAVLNKKRNRVEEEDPSTLARPKSPLALREYVVVTALSDRDSLRRHLYSPPRLSRRRFGR